MPDTCPGRGSICRLRRSMCSGCRCVRPSASHEGYSEGPDLIHCRIRPYMKSRRRRARRRWPGVSAGAQPWRGPPRRTPGQTPRATQIKRVIRRAYHPSAKPSSSAVDCPARGQSVKGGPLGRRSEPTAPQRGGAYEGRSPRVAHSFAERVRDDRDRNSQRNK